MPSGPAALWLGLTSSPWSILLGGSCGPPGFRERAQTLHQLQRIPAGDQCAVSCRHLQMGAGLCLSNGDACPALRAPVGT